MPTIPSAITRLMATTANPNPGGGGGTDPLPLPVADVGADPSWDGGTVADIIVPDDQPTIAAALAAAGALGGQRVIRLKASGSPYREYNNLETFQGVIGRYGTDDVRILGSEPLTGLVPCTVADAEFLGPNWPNCYRTTVANNAYEAAAPTSLNLYEGETALIMATDRSDLSRAFYVKDYETYHIADQFVLDGSLNISGIVDPDVISKYSLAELQNGYVMLYHSPNVTSPEPILSKTGDGQINIPASHKQNGSSTNYALMNMTSQMRQGTWSVVSGATEATVYVWPYDPANIGDIEYSARSNIFNVNSATPGKIRFEGLSLFGSAGDDGDYGGCVLKSTAFTKKSHGIEFFQCRLGRTLNPTDGYGVVAFRNVDHFLLERCTVESCPDGGGVFMLGGSLGTEQPDSTYPDADRAKYGKATQNYFVKIGGSAIRGYCQGFFELSYNEFEDVGSGAHSNKTNFYEQSDAILIYGNTWNKNCGGYITLQECSRFFVGFNRLHTGPREGDTRCIQDQNYTLRSDSTGLETTSGNPPPVYNSLCLVWNNEMRPNAEFSAVPNAAVLGNDTMYAARTRWGFLNNIAFGGGIKHGWSSGPYYATGIEALRDGNVYAERASWQETNDTWKPKASEYITDDPYEIWENPTPGDPAQDYTLVPTGPGRTRRGVSITSAIAEAVSLFPDFDFTRDIKGVSFDPADPPAGCEVFV